MLLGVARSDGRAVNISAGSLSSHPTTDLESDSIQDMDLESLRALPVKDQQIFLLGRIASETTSMDAALRFVNAALRGQGNVDAYLDAPDFFSTNAKACQKLVKQNSDVDDETRKAVLSAVLAGSKAYSRRNRYIHDLLRRDLLDQSWQLAPLTRQPESSPEFEAVSFDDMVALVLEIVTATWRLRGCALYILQGSWAEMALGAVEGEWDGKATYAQ
jgi:hypothetical protein